MTDEFTKKTVKKFGPRGSPVFEQEESTTDLDDLEERVEQTTVPFCECGAPIMTEPADVYRCVECELLCCQRCQIELSRYHYCPRCAQRRFDVDKRTFLSLVFLDRGLMEPDDLVQLTTEDGIEFEIVIEPAATAVMEHDYLTPEGGLSPEGTEALHVGKQLYGQDGDVQAVMDQLRFQAVVDR